MAIKTMTEEQSTDLRILVDVRNKLLRPGLKSVRDRKSALGEGTKSVSNYVYTLSCILEDMEDASCREINRIANTIKLVGVVSNIPGCDKDAFVSFLAYVPRPEDYTSVSALWRYVGVDPTDEDKSYNPDAKREAYNVVGRLISGNNHYYTLYKNKQAEYLDIGWSPGHSDIAAKRFVMKAWLAHLYETTRLMTGKETSVHEAIDRYGEDAIHKKEDYGWPSIED